MIKIQGTQEHNVVMNVLPSTLFDAVDKYLRKKQCIPYDAWISSCGHITVDGHGGSHSWDEHLRVATDEDKELLKLLKTLKGCMT